MEPFIVFPAIDLRHGEVVRLQEGDPLRLKTYSLDPNVVAEKWLHAGCHWLHVVNLDGAFGEKSEANTNALVSILKTASRYQAKVQFGGGLRTIEAVEAALQMGVTRAVVGTLAVEQPEIIPKLVYRYGVDRVAVSLDGRDGLVHVHGWQFASVRSVQETAIDLTQAGLKWLVFTDISRDGLMSGLNMEATSALKQATHINVIASGGVRNWDDIQAAQQASLAGVIVGKALYEGTIDPTTLFSLSK